MTGHKVAARDRISGAVEEAPVRKRDDVAFIERPKARIIPRSG